MRCCSCWSMKTGALLVGIWNFVLPLLAAIPLVGYLVNTDVPGLNFIQENYQALLKGVSNFLKGHVWTKDMHEQILTVVENIFPTLRQMTCKTCKKHGRKCGNCEKWCFRWPRS